MDSLRTNLLYTALLSALAGCAANATAPGAPAAPAPQFAQSALRAAAPAAARGYRILHVFGGCPDGANPVGGVFVDRNGTIFGTTTLGGTSCPADDPGFGTVFVMLPSAGTYSERIVASFDGADGAYPRARPSVDTSGDLFVTTSEGGAAGTNGTITEFSAAGGYAAAAAFDFPSTGGNGPAAPFLQADGETILYGTTYAEGAPGPNNFGSIVAVTEAGLAETDLYHFAGPPADGSFPTSHLVKGPDGALYGTTTDGGSAGDGTVFRFVPSANGGNETVIWNFGGGSDGAHPQGGVVVDASGNLFGTTSQGGTPGYGTVFELEPKNGRYREKILHAFQDTRTGSPYASLAIRPEAGLLYGTTTSGGGTGCTICGAIFQISTTGSQFAILHEFSGGSDGSQPFNSPLFWNGKALYGTTEYGGNQSGPNGNGQGVVFRYVP